MYKMTRDGLTPEEHGVTGPLAQIEEVKAKGLPVAFVGDVVGTGSSRKSATNSVLWFFGDDIPGCRTSAAAASASAARWHRSSTTPWKMPAPWSSRRRWTT
jgi:aconitase B